MSTVKTLASVVLVVAVRARDDSVRGLEVAKVTPVSAGPVPDIAPLVVVGVAERQLAAAERPVVCSERRSVGAQITLPWTYFPLQYVWHVN